MGADHTERYFPFFQQTNQKGPGNVQEFRRLLRRKFMASCTDRYRSTGGHVIQDVDQEFHRTVRQFYRLFLSLIAWAENHWPANLHE